MIISVDSQKKSQKIVESKKISGLFTKYYLQKNHYKLNNQLQAEVENSMFSQFVFSTYILLQ